jgi:regulator of PEP synthase PpsR (kinase-PPPase family)
VPAVPGGVNAAQALAQATLRPVSDPPRKPTPLFIVSDGTGETAAAVAKAALAQFQVEGPLRRFGGIRHEGLARRVAAEAEKVGALVVFTLVDRRVARALLEESNRRGVPTVDVLGGVIAKMAEHLHAEPRSEPGLLHGFSDDYFRRVDAVEFAVQHDDGANLHTLYRADLVLTGVSRTSKTPLSMYLAQRGYKTGNVPLVPGVVPPRELLELNPKRVFGLVGDVENLSAMRRARARSMGGTPYHHYTDVEGIAREVDESLRLFRSRGWRWIDISNRAVEENASKILEMMQGYRGGFPA